MTAPVRISEQPGATPVGHQGARVEIHERPARSASGWLGVVVVLACVGAVIGLAYTPVRGLIAIPIVIGLVVAASLVDRATRPDQGRAVLRQLRRHRASRPGCGGSLPLTDRRNVSVRVRNFETNHLKVNDADGNPVEIAAIVVWQVADTSRAVYAVDDYVNFVRVQAESALRHVATTHPYDDPASEGTSLRGSTDVVAGELAQEVAAAGRDRRGRDRRGADQPSRLRLRDRPGDAAPTAGQRRRRGALPHRRGRRRDGRDGPRPRSTSAASSSSTRNARRRWSATCWSCSAPTSRPRRSSTPARSIREPTSANRSCCASTRRSTTPWPAGPPTSSAASTPTSRCCCAVPSPTPAGCPGAAPIPRRGRPRIPVPRGGR